MAKGSKDKESINKSNNNNTSTTEKRGNSWIGDLTYPLRDLLLAGLGKGQFILVSAVVLIALFIWRCPSESLPTTFNNILIRFGDNYLTGWILFFVCLMAWFFHYKYIRKIYDKELKRIEYSKDELQKQIFNFLNKK